MPFLGSRTPSPTFIKNSVRQLVAKMEGGWELIGTSLRKDTFIEKEHQDVINAALDAGLIIQAAVKPARYRLTLDGRRLLRS